MVVQVSIIIPCYKQAQFVTDALASVAVQTAVSWECIVVNDGSPDDTSGVVRKFIAAHPNLPISLLEKENEGLAEARNFGILRSKGDWILPLDSDDRLAPTFLEEALRASSENPQANLVYCDLHTFGRDSVLVVKKPYSRELLMRETMFPYASMYKRTLWEKVGGYSPVVPFGAEDWNFWLDCSKRGLIAVKIPKALFLYRRHIGPSMVDGVNQFQAEVEACLHTCHPDLYSAAHLDRSHAIIASAQDEVVDRIEQQVMRYSDRHLPYFWRGLVRAKHEHLRAALRDFRTSAQLSNYSDWQPLLHLRDCAHEIGNIEEAQDANRRYAQALSMTQAGSGSTLQGTAKQRPISIFNADQNSQRIEIKEPKLISVALTCYQYAQYLPDAVGSLLLQTYPNWECVIVNDGSSDGTSDIARSLIMRHSKSRIRLLEKSNEGLAEARNSGFNEARGSLFVMLDADDMFAPTYFEQAAQIFEKSARTNLVYSYVQEFGANSELKINCAFSKDLLLRENVFHGSSVFRRGLFERSGGYIPVVPWGCEDYNLWLSFLELGLEPHHIHEPMLLYRKHQKGSMSTPMEDNLRFVFACVRTCHPRLYSIDQLVEEHKVIADMNIASFERIDRNIKRFPEWSVPYLWRALKSEREGQLWRARRDLEAAVKLADEADWQPLFSLMLIQARLGLSKLAATTCCRLLRHFPQFAEIKQIGEFQNRLENSFAR